MNTKLAMESKSGCRNPTTAVEIGERRQIEGDGGHVAYCDGCWYGLAEGVHRCPKCTGGAGIIRRYGANPRNAKSRVTIDDLFTRPRPAEKETK